MTATQTFEAWWQGAVTGSLLSLRIAATPSAASRPRVARYGVYYEKSYAAWMGEVQRQVAEQLVGREPLQGPLLCHVETLVARPKTTKLSTPRGDVDNYCKGALDGLTKAGVWGDDGQVTTLISSKRFAAPGESPGAIIHIGVQA